MCVFGTGAISHGYNFECTRSITLHNYIFIWYLLKNINILEKPKPHILFIFIHTLTSNTVYTVVISYHQTPDNESTAYRAQQTRKKYIFANSEYEHNQEP